ncbi:hypothetical protein, partial [uncultured Christiangramia sp.]|uniref:hypothetical protein n=1 Tax=uncultured Christiangramia sp. TaxID=503836 RepID=UPI0025FDCBBA
MARNGKPSVENIATIVTEFSSTPKEQVISKILAAENQYEFPEIFMTMSSAEALLEDLLPFAETGKIKQKKWGAHLNTNGSLFYWIFDYIYTPLSATMFALLAFFVASASYRAFRIRNFEATLLLISGII